MHYLVVKNKVQDFDKWKQSFSEGGAGALPGAGMEMLHVFRDLEDPGIALLFCKVTNLEQAQAFTKQALSQTQDGEDSEECGVIGTPEVSWWAEEVL